MFFCRRAFYQAPMTLMFVLSAHLNYAQDFSTDNSFAIVGVNVIPMDEDRMIEDQTVVVTDGVIQRIGDAATTQIPSGITTIEGNDRYLMPGLADLHVHILHADDFVNYLAWGVTTVMHLGGTGIPGTDILEFRKQIAAGTLLGPNIYTTDRIFDPAQPTLPFSLSRTFIMKYTHTFGG